MGKDREDLKKEDVVQAVIVADTYDNAFGPITEKTPKCLLPLAGRPLLDHTLQCLFLSSVQEVILYLTSHHSQVKEWLAKSPWCEGNPSISITTIVNENSRCFGDAMRDLDEKGILRHNFFLVHGDLVGNVDLLPILEEHKTRATVDKASIMTSVYFRSLPGHPLRTNGKEVVLATDKDTRQVLFYQRSTNTSTNFPVELFQHDEVDLRFDLSDPGVAVCSPAVLALFSDNFDIQDLDALTNEILESELVSSTIYMSVLEEGMAARASNPYMFMELGIKMLNRWFYPIVPERRKGGENSRYLYGRGNIYKGSGTVIGRGSKIIEDCLIGHRTKIGSGCLLSCSVIGEDCEVGANCELINCVLLDKVKVGDGVKLNNCVVGEGAILPNKCQVGERVILGPGVTLRDGVKVPTETRLVSVKCDDGFSDGEDAMEEESEFGPKAFVFKDDDEDDGDESEDEDKPKDASYWGDIFLTDDDEDSDDSSEDDDGSIGHQDINFSDDESQGEEENEHDDVKNFRREVIDSVTRGLEEGINTDNLVLEINGSKHAWNTTLSEVNQCVIYAVLTLNSEQASSSGPAALLAKVKSNIESFKDLLKKYSKSKSGQKYFLEGIEEVLARHSSYLDIIAKILHFLYDEDILEDTVILAWVEDEGKDADLMKRVKVKCKALIEWLEESDSEEESD